MPVLNIYKYIADSAVRTIRQSTTMGRKSTKGKEKKQQKRAAEKAAREMVAESQALVDEANKMKDPMEQLLAFKKYERNGLSLNISCVKVGDLDEKTIQWAFELTKRNMEVLYESSGWGWNDKQKLEEMEEDTAWYLIARDSEDKPLAMSHFRFDLDNEIEVLYCYEVQLQKEVRRKGLGKFLMQILELMSHKMQMKKVMLTIFKENEGAKKFFKDKLKYTVDETSPEESFAEAMFDEDGYTYEILSKTIPPRKPLAHVTHQQQVGTTIAVQ